MSKKNKRKAMGGEMEILAVSPEGKVRITIIASWVWPGEHTHKQ
jgi:hypothetical protein